VAARQDALKRNVVEKREEVADDVDRLKGQLQQRYRSATDWRQVGRGHPWLSLLVGTLAGSLLGFVLASLGGPQEITWED